VVRDDNDDFVGHVVYHVMMAVEKGEYFEMLPELT
jgi:hypothetical protein